MSNSHVKFSQRAKRSRMDILVASKIASERRAVAARVFKEWPGIAVRHAWCLDTLKSRLQARQFDLIFLSDTMAVRGDLEALLKFIRSDPPHLAVPVTILASTSHEMRAVEALRWNAHLIDLDLVGPDHIIEHLARAHLYRRSRQVGRIANIYLGPLDMALPGQMADYLPRIRGSNASRSPSPR